MNFRYFMAAVLTAFWMLISSSALLAQGDGLLSRADKRAYHACLYARWIDGYCRFHGWDYVSESFADCIIANDGCQCAYAKGGYWGPDIDQACAAVVAHRRRR